MHVFHFLTWLVLRQYIDQNVLTLLGSVLDLVGGTVDDEVLPLVTAIVGLLAQLLNLILALVEDVAVQVVQGVVQRIGGLVDVAIRLSAKQVLDTLQIQY